MAIAPLSGGNADLPAGIAGIAGIAGRDVRPAPAARALRASPGMGTLSPQRHRAYAERVTRAKERRRS